MGSRPVLLSLSCLIPLACAPALAPGPAKPSLETRLDDEVALRSEGPPAGWYDLRRPVAVQGLEAQILAQLQAVAVRVGRPAPRTDESAQRAARDICRGLLPEGPPPAALVEFAMRNSGLVDPPPHLVVATVSEGADQSFLEQLGARVEVILRGAVFTRVGVGAGNPLRAPEQRRVVIALFEGRLQFRPLPRVINLGRTLSVDLEFRGAHHSARLVLADPEGHVESRPMTTQGGRSVATLACSQRGTYQVEVTGEGSYGTEVLANFPIYCGTSPPAQVRYLRHSPQPGGEEELEREVLGLTNRMRAEHGLPPLHENAGVARVAREHSRDMLRNKFVGHISPSTGSPADRLRRGGVVHLVARENVARAYSAEEAMNELMKSPAHRANVLATDVTELGVGVAVDRSNAATPVVFVTQNFVRPGTVYDASLGVDPLYAMVRRARTAAGRPPLSRDRDLEGLSARYLRTLTSSGGGQRQADDELGHALQLLGHRFRQIEGVLVRLSVIDGLAQAEEVRRQGSTHVGLAAAESKTGLVVFVLLATARVSR